VKSFRLEEYALKLKEKKRLTHLCGEIASLGGKETTSIMDEYNCEGELKSIEKVWSKFDNYIQLRESLLEKAFRKYEQFQLQVQRVDRLYESCERRMDQIESEFFNV
jgi:hypothetical protein